MNLVRQLEPEVMDSAEEARDYDAMDHAAVNAAFVADFLASGFASGEVLDLGTGTALIPIELCRRHLDCRVLAVDLAAAMLDLARLNVERAGLGPRVELAQADAKGLPFRPASFDAVLSNSILHHLAEPERALAEAARVVRPGGRLFFRDLLRPESESELAELVARHAAHERPASQQLLADSLRAALTLDEIRAAVQTAGFERRTVARSSDRHWTFSAAK